MSDYNERVTIAINKAAREHLEKLQEACAKYISDANMQNTAKWIRSFLQDAVDTEQQPDALTVAYMAGVERGKDVERSRQQAEAVPEKVKEHLTNAVEGPLLRDGINRDMGGINDAPDADYIFNQVRLAFDAMLAAAPKPNDR